MTPIIITEPFDCLPTRQKKFWYGFRYGGTVCGFHTQPLNVLFQNVILRVHLLTGMDQNGPNNWNGPYILLLLVSTKGCKNSHQRR